MKHLYNATNVSIQNKIIGVAKKISIFKRTLYRHIQGPHIIFIFVLVAAINVASLKNKLYLNKKYIKFIKSFQTKAGFEPTTLLYTRVFPQNIWHLGTIATTYLNQNLDYQEAPI